MNLLIIGSKGFIGRNIVEYFHNTGRNVTECDVLVDYNNPDYFQVDASNADYREVILSSEYDVCINCSGAASVPDSFHHNYRDFSMNVANVYKLLNAIKEFQPSCKFINLGSAAVYGNPNKIPICETEPTKPISPYGIHKKQAEEINEEFHKFFNIPTISLRIFSAYGEGLKKQLFWDLYQKSLKSNAMELFGTGNESRDFIHIYDLARAIEFIANNALFNGQTINVANGEEVKIGDVCRTFLNITGYMGSLSFDGNVREGDPTNWKADISLLQQLGYSKTVNMEEGLNRYYQWIRNA